MRPPRARVARPGDWGGRSRCLWAQALAARCLWARNDLSTCIVGCTATFHGAAGARCCRFAGSFRSKSRADTWRGRSPPPQAVRRLMAWGLLSSAFRFVSKQHTKGIAFAIVHMQATVVLRTVVGGGVGGWLSFPPT